MQPKFSIVVPMYDVERYLDQCVESLIGQTLQEIEVVLVDDGSPDCCGEMADAYAQRDHRIKVVHRENGGLGPARNSGLDVATGTYVGFVDSDDWVDREMYARLYEALEQNGADICFSGLKDVDYGVITHIYRHPFAGQLLVGDDEIFSLRKSFYGNAIAKVKEDAVPVSVGDAGYRREFLSEKHIRFVDVRSEDMIFNTLACRVAHSVCVVDGAYYNYRHDGQLSITSDFSRRTLADFATFYETLALTAASESDQYRKECTFRVKRCIIDSSRVLSKMISLSNLSRNSKLEYLAEVAEMSRVRWACYDFPYRKLPFRQEAFYGVLSRDLPGWMLLLVGLRAHFSCRYRYQ